MKYKRKSIDVAAFKITEKHVGLWAVVDPRDPFTIRLVQQEVFMQDFEETEEMKAKSEKEPDKK
jgi:hypothetical protein